MISDQIGQKVATISQRKMAPVQHCAVHQQSLPNLRRAQGGEQSPVQYGAPWDLPNKKVPETICGSDQNSTDSIWHHQNRSSVGNFLRVAAYFSDNLSRNSTFATHVERRLLSKLYWSCSRESSPDILSRNSHSPRHIPVATVGPGVVFVYFLDQRFPASEGFFLCLVVVSA
jgi:hypothetical protein